MNDIIKDIYKAAEEVNSWPEWKKAISGIESDYTITKIDFSKLKKNKKFYDPEITTTEMYIPKKEVYKRYKRSVNE